MMAVAKLRRGVVFFFQLQIPTQKNDKHTAKNSKNKFSLNQYMISRHATYKSYVFFYQ